MKVLFGVITYNRTDSLVRCLKSLEKITIPTSLEVEILVVENDKNKPSESIVNETNWLHPTHYELESKRGIPCARNKVLKHSLNKNFQYLYFIDDDEIVSKNILMEAYKAMVQYDVDAVHGPYEPIFEQKSLLPRELYSKWPNWKTGKALKTAATGNVLINLKSVKKHDVWFDESLQFSGGSDIRFFTELYNKGFKIVWCSEAKAQEYVPAQRLKFKWIAKRYLRYGSTRYHQMRQSFSLAVTLKKSIRALLAYSLRSISDHKLSLSSIVAFLIKMLYVPGFFLGVLGYKPDDYFDNDSNILMITDHLEVGGVARNYVNLANHFYSRDKKVTILCLNKKGPFEDKLNNNIEVAVLPKGRSIVKLFKLVQYINRENYGIILSAKEHVNVLSFWAHILTFFKGKYIATINTNLVLDFKNRQSAWARKLKFLNQISLPFIKNLVSVSDGTGKSVAELTSPLRPKPITTIYNPVVFESDIESTFEKPQHPWFSEKKKVLVSVGRLTPQKNFKLLIESFSLIAEKDDLYLIILGEGEQRPDLERLIAEKSIGHRVCLQGYENNVLSYIAHCELLVVTSLWEGFCNVIVEALACGTKVISSNCPSGPREILNDKRLGALVDGFDPIDYAKAITLKINESVDPSLLKNRAKDFTVEKIGDQYLQYFRNAN